MRLKIEYTIVSPTASCWIGNMMIIHWNGGKTTFSIKGKMMNDPPKKEVRCLKDMGVPPRNEDMWLPSPPRGMAGEW